MIDFTNADGFIAYPIIFTLIFFLMGFFFYVVHKIKNDEKETLRKESIKPFTKRRKNGNIEEIYNEVDDQWYNLLMIDYITDDEYYGLEEESIHQKAYEAWKEKRLIESFETFTTVTTQNLQLASDIDEDSPEELVVQEKEVMVEVIPEVDDEYDFPVIKNEGMNEEHLSVVSESLEPERDKLAELRSAYSSSDSGGF